VDHVTVLVQGIVWALGSLKQVFLEVFVQGVLPFCIYGSVLLVDVAHKAYKRSVESCWKEETCFVVEEEDEETSIDVVKKQTLYDEAVSLGEEEGIGIAYDAFAVDKTSIVYFKLMY
jgi:hypothetical protein